MSGKGDEATPQFLQDLADELRGMGITLDTSPTNEPINHQVLEGPGIPEFAAPDDAMAVTFEPIPFRNIKGTLRFSQGSSRGIPIKVLDVAIDGHALLHLALWSMGKHDDGCMVDDELHRILIDAHEMFQAPMADNQRREVGQLVVDTLALAGVPHPEIPGVGTPQVSPAVRDKLAEREGK